MRASELVCNFRERETREKVDVVSESAGGPREEGGGCLSRGARGRRGLAKTRRNGESAGCRQQRGKAVGAADAVRRALLLSVGRGQEYERHTRLARMRTFRK